LPYTTLFRSLNGAAVPLRPVGAYGGRQVNARHSGPAQQVHVLALRRLNGVNRVVDELRIVDAVEVRPVAQPFSPGRLHVLAPLDVGGGQGERIPGSGSAQQPKSRHGGRSARPKGRTASAPPPLQKTGSRPRDPFRPSRPCRPSRPFEPRARLQKRSTTFRPCPPETEPHRRPPFPPR